MTKIIFKVDFDPRPLAAASFNLAAARQRVFRTLCSELQARYNEKPLFETRCSDPKPHYNENPCSGIPNYDFFLKIFLLEIHILNLKLIIAFYLNWGSIITFGSMKNLVYKTLTTTLALIPSFYFLLFFCTALT